MFQTIWIRIATRTPFAVILVRVAEADKYTVTHIIVTTERLETQLDTRNASFVSHMCTFERDMEFSVSPQACMYPEWICQLIHIGRGITNTWKIYKDWTTIPI